MKELFNTIFLSNGKIRGLEEMRCTHEAYRQIMKNAYITIEELSILCKMNLSKHFHSVEDFINGMLRKD
jgi:hypothetical protein